MVSPFSISLKVGYQEATYTIFVCYAIFCLIHYYFYKKVCKEVLNGQRLCDGKGILWIGIGVTIIGIAVVFINHFLWLKYSIIIAILILLIVIRNTVINIVKDMIGKLADRLSCGRPMVQGEIGQTDTYLFYSFSNKRETS